MKITRNRIREIVKETLNKRLVEQEPASDPATQDQAQGDEPRADVGKLLSNIVGASGNDARVQKLQQVFAPLNPENKSRVIDALVKQVLGIDLGDQYVKAAVQKGLQDK